MQLHHIAPHMPYVNVNVNLTKKIQFSHIGHIYLWGGGKMNKIYYFKSHFGQVA